MGNIDDNAKSTKGNYLGRLLYQGTLEKVDTYTPDLVRHLVFISSILVGFMFTVISDLVLSPQSENNFIITIIFSCLMASSFSLFASIILGAVFQYLLNIEITEQLRNTKHIDSKESVNSKEDDDEFFKNINKFFAEEVAPLFRFVLGGSVSVLIFFLIGIFFFIISFILIGWIHSSSFVLIAFAISIGLGIISLYGGYKMISLYVAYRKTRDGK